MKNSSSENLNTDIFRMLNIPIDPQNQISDQKQLSKILFEILNYPNQNLAYLHFKANRLGNYDLSPTRKTTKLDDNSQLIEKQYEYCDCCGLMKQNQSISYCTSFNQILNLGNTCYLFFNSIINSILMMFLLSVTYSIYSVTKNISSCSKLDCFSFAMKVATKKFQDEFRSWLGVILSIVWSLYFCYMTYNERKIEIKFNKMNISISDFTILAQNVPQNLNNEENFQKMIDEYVKKIQSVDSNLQISDLSKLESDLFKIQTFNKTIPFYKTVRKDPQLQKLKDKYNSLLQEFTNWIKYRINNQSISFELDQKKRQQKYSELQQLQLQIIQQYKNTIKKYQTYYQKKIDLAQNNTVLITFKYTKAHNLILEFNKDDVRDQFRDLITSISQDNRLPNILISKAPEPYNIIWKNIGVPKSLYYKRYSITIFVMLLTLIASFACIYLLKVLTKEQENNQIISFLLSIIIILINKVLEAVISYSTIFQLNFTKIRYQRSFAVKTAFAQLINNIVITFLSDRFINNNINQSGGLLQDIYYIGLSNAILTPLITLLNIPYFIRLIKLKLLRNPVKLLNLNQQKLNQLTQLAQFDIGMQYIYIVNTCLFTSFFVTLQPILSIFAVIGLLLMYWIQKWNLLKRSTRPAPGSEILKNSMNQLIFLCPIAFTLGNLIFPYFIPDNFPNKLSQTANYISLAISIFFYIVPFSIIFKKSIHEYVPNSCYDDARIYFNTQYDRLNPLTSQKGQENYKKYLKLLQKSNQNKANDTKLNLINTKLNQFNSDQSQRECHNEFIPFKTFRKKKNMKRNQQDKNIVNSSINHKKQ